VKTQGDTVCLTEWLKFEMARYVTTFSLQNTFLGRKLQSGGRRIEYMAHATFYCSS
jgi:hypothetical protein